MDKNELVNMLDVFGSQVVDLHQQLTSKRGKTVLANQLLRSGTSVGANISEALRGQSERDFMAKMHIADKEAHETAYWLKLLKESNYIDDPDTYSRVYRNCMDLVRVTERITDKDPNMRDWLERA